jgi:transglutaminase-like putative cysteine protease
MTGWMPHLRKHQCQTIYSMKFEISTKLTYEARSSSTLILNIQPFQSSGQFVTTESFTVNPELTFNDWIFPAGERRIKVITIPKPGKIEINYQAAVDRNIQVIDAAQLIDVPIDRLPVSVLPYLNPSRYCQSDKLYKFALHNFGRYEQAYEKVQAVCEWIYKNVEYAGGYTTPQTSAFDTITDQFGVCRDFAHLGVALCRALTIPARYLTCYAYRLRPPDFHACFEVYLGGYWIVADASNLVPLNGIVKIATGLDAAETAFASIFGNLLFMGMEIKFDLVSSEELVNMDTIGAKGICLH